MEMLIDDVDKEENSSLAAVAAVLPATDSLLTVRRQVVPTRGACIRLVVQGEGRRLVSSSHNHVT
eukprot:COSAG06_NODE_2187_length_7387_cov_8.558452_2_plen_65_part_00